MDLPHLRDFRKRAVMSQEQLAARSGVARDTISKLESGHRKAYPSTVQKLATGLNVEPRMLLGGVEYLDEGPGEETTREAPADEGRKKDGERRIGF
jgi:transcriptional regulator with XRE-family HTH domain